VLPVFSFPVRTILDCGSTRAALGVFNLLNGRLQCLHNATARFPVRAGGEERWLENMAAALQVLNAERHWTGPVTLVLPAHLTLTKHIKIPRVEPSKRAKIIQFEAEQAIPYALEEVIWDSVISGQRVGEEEVMIVAAKCDILEQLCAAAKAAGFAPRRVLPSSLATLAAYRLAQPGPSQSALIINLGARSTNLLQAEGSRFVARTFACGSDAVDPLASRLAHEINRSVAHFTQQLGLANPTRLFLTGEGARLTGLGEALAGKLKLPVEDLEVGDAADHRTGATPTEFSASLLGAAAIELRATQPAMNLLPARLLERENLHRRQPWVLAAAILAVAALVPPILHYRQATATVRAKIAAMDEALTPLRARESRYRANLDRLEQLKAEVSHVQSVHDRRASWLQLFTGLQERLLKVEDVWLERLQTIPASADTPMKLVISGCMLDKTNPLAKASPEAFTRVKDLLTGLVELPAVSAVEDERFDNSQPGILKFDFVVVVDSTQPL
jgi:type IV pilus assembly protein PilM